LPEATIRYIRLFISNRIDQMVYKLYGLTNEEIKVMEDRK